MILLAADIRRRLEMNAAARGGDHCPVTKFFNPLGPGTWLPTELQPDGDTFFGLVDLGLGLPELGCFSLAELREMRLRYGLNIQRDRVFASSHPISIWAVTARVMGSVRTAESILKSAERRGAANDAVRP